MIIDSPPQFDKYYTSSSGNRQGRVSGNLEQNTTDRSDLFSSSAAKPTTVQSSADLKFQDVLNLGSYYANRERIHQRKFLCRLFITPQHKKGREDIAHRQVMKHFCQVHISEIISCASLNKESQISWVMWLVRGQLIPK